MKLMKYAVIGAVVSAKRTPPVVESESRGGAFVFVPLLILALLLTVFFRISWRK